GQSATANLIGLLYRNSSRPDRSSNDEKTKAYKDETIEEATIPAQPAPQSRIDRSNYFSIRILLSDILNLPLLCNSPGFRHSLEFSSAAQLILDFWPSWLRFSIEKPHYSEVSLELGLVY